MELLKPGFCNALRYKVQVLPSHSHTLRIRTMRGRAPVHAVPLTLTWTKRYRMVSHTIRHRPGALGLNLRLC